jgi:hypothetical protein
MRVVCGLVVAVALGSPLRAEVTVKAAGGHVDITANAAPLADVLDRLARQTGMKVVYEGPAPRQLVTVSLLGRSPAQAVHDLLEGQGLNYALLGDSAGTGVQTLLMTGQASSVGGSSGSSPAAAAASAFKPRTGAPPPMSSADTVEEVEDEPEEEPVAEPAPVVPGAPGANNEGVPGVGQQGAPGSNPGGIPNPLLPLLPPGTSIGGANPTPGAPVQNAPAAPRAMTPPAVPGFIPVNPLSPLGPFAPVIPATPGSPAGTPGSATEPAEPKDPPR